MTNLEDCLTASLKRCVAKDERSFGFGELRAYLRANIGDDTLMAGQEAAVFRHFGDHYDLRRWPFSDPRWSFIEG
jgi:hypothetical protein